MDGRQAGDTDARSFDGQDFIDGTVSKKLFEDLSQFTDKRDIDLMIQETVHFQDISAYDPAIRHDFLLQQIQLSHFFPFLS